MIGQLNSCMIMVTDDLALAANTSHAMQTALNIAEMDAYGEHYSYNECKTKTIAIKTRQPPTLVFNNKLLGMTHKEIHMGIYRFQQFRYSPRLNNDSKMASLLPNGSRLTWAQWKRPSSRDINIFHIVIPELTYCIEVLALQMTEIKQLEAYHRKNLHFIQHIPQSTAVPAIYLLTGTAQKETQLHIKALSCYKILQRLRARVHLQLSLRSS